MRPSAAKRAHARLAVERDTPCSAASPASVGNREPGGPYSPASSFARSTFATRTYGAKVGMIIGNHKSCQGIDLCEVCEVG
jgi:hypothetical protein